MAADSGRRRVPRVGCVRFLNAKPLIDGLEPADGQTTFDVPSALLPILEAGDVDVALCPVIDYYRSRVPLRLVPVGGISCQGPTLTVRLFSRVLPHQIRCVRVDRDSHTSVALLQVLLDRCYGIRPQLLPATAEPGWPGVEAVMLIGDKVVTCPPARRLFPHHFDLGQMWYDSTQLPFVFAVWMCRQEADLGELPARLRQVRRANARRIDELVQRHAQAHGWPCGLANRYLGQLLHYEVRSAHLRAIERFASMASDLGLIDQVRPLKVWPIRETAQGRE